MVNYPHNNLFNRGDTERQLKIAFSGGTITNKEIHQGSFELTESLCSEESLRFGTCEASVVKFKVHNVVTSLMGETLTVYEILNGNTAEPFYYGKYKVYSDKPTADRKYREIVAYDAMYDVLNADVASWYNSISFPCTIGYLRKRLLSYLKIEYVDKELVNDGIYINKTIDVTELSGKQVINAICEINGCFGHINRQGKFQFVTLSQHDTGLFPSETLYPSDNLFPVEVDEEKLFSTSKYSACKYEDFETQLITGLQIRQEEDDIGATVGTLANAYVVENNFLVYGKSHEELVAIGNNLLNAIKNISYRPIDYVKTNGKPYLEVGDAISIGSREVIIETYILERTIRGLNGQKDEFSARGTEYYPKEINGLNRQITQIKGRYNKLTRTVDETRSEIGNLETKTETRFVQTADAILAEAKRASEAESSLRVTADQIQANVNTVSYNLKNNYLTITETESKINASSDGILLSVSKDYETIVNANSYYTSLQSQIDINESNINLKVSSSEVQSMISVSLSNITITAGQIDLRGYATINNGFSIDTSGNAKLSDGTSTAYLSGGYLIISSNSGVTSIGSGSLVLGNGLSSYVVADVDFNGKIALNANTLNGYTPITDGNIYSYIKDYDSEISSINSTISGIETELSNLSTQYWSLDRRISALEKAI